jgi:subtilisin family serine protease
LIDYGGNWAINTRAGADYLTAGGLGELSTGRGFAAGRLLAEFSGTSMAAPHVAHLAASVLAEYPETNANMIRALLLAHGAVPGACRALLPNEDILRCVCGYGVTDSGALFRSLENEVTLLAQTASQQTPPFLRNPDP